MSRYRILKVSRHPYWANNVEYVVQKRVLGFLWWWAVDSDYPYGYYDTLKEAEERLEAERQKDTITIVKEI